LLAKILAKRDHGNFILINYSAHINNSPRPSSRRGSCFKSDERLVFPEFLHGSNSLFFYLFIFFKLHENFKKFKACF